MKKLIFIILFCLCTLISHSQMNLEGNKYNSKYYLYFDSPTDKHPLRVNSSSSIEFIKNFDSLILIIESIDRSSSPRRFWAYELSGVLNDEEGKYRAVLYSAIDIRTEKPVIIGLKYNYRKRLIRIGIVSGESGYSYEIEYSIDYL